MNILLRLFRTYRLKNVFTPSSIARLTYVERLELERDLKKFLEMPGMQIVLYGHSGCGKSTIINNILDELKIRKITSRCESSTTLNDLLLNAFDKLDLYYTSEKSCKESSSIKSELIAKYSEIGAAISGTLTQEEGTTSKRIIPVQLTTQRLAEFLGAANCIWIIEDFHKVNDVEKKKIADVLKIFVDTSTEYPNVKIVCIGAVGTARELVELDSNLSTRIAEIYVPLLKDTELEQIAKKGFNYMNVSFNGPIKNKIIYYSNNLASVCHQICYDICYNKELTKSKLFTTKIREEDFKTAVSSFVRKNTDTYTKIYDRICTDRHRKDIIVSLFKCEKEFIGGNELFKETKKVQSLPKPVFDERLNELISIEYDEVIRFDRNSKKYSFSSPFFQAFVKMKLALEDIEQKERDLKKRRKFDLSSDFVEKFPMSMLITDKFLEGYYQELDTYFSRRIEQIKRIENMQNEMLKKNRK
ncbi:ATP-binding protein [Roseimarinus sediminis]|uniref:ATP-binding protein n=1 Tax=Roseimarinus sediminis TaxID=1610899 RepID=UPI003D1AC39A